MPPTNGAKGAAAATASALQHCPAGEQDNRLDKPNTDATQALDLAREIEIEHQAAHKAASLAFNHAVKCGELLLKAKAELGPGAWLPWLAENTSIGARQAQNYMRIARNREVLANTQRAVSHLPMREAVALLAEPKPRLTREQHAARINAKWREAQQCRAKMVACLAEVRASFADDGGDQAFKGWLGELGIGQEGAGVIVGLLDLGDPDAWDEALIAALERAREAGLAKT